MLDLTHMLSGPYGTMLLTDMGMRTIKVEPPVGGEGTRRLLETHEAYSRNGMGAYFMTLNRNKMSVGIDLKSTEGREVFLDLVRQADVVFDNFSPGVTERLGIDYDSLSAVNPRIVTCSVTGFGLTGPARDRPAFDMVAQGMGGGMSITGSPEAGPTRAGIPIGDLGGGVFAAIGTLAALHERQRTGKGTRVDISMLDCQVSMLNYMATMFLMSGEQPGQVGNGHFVHVPYNTFQTRTCHIIIAVIFDSFWPKVVDLLDIDALRDPRYDRQPARLADKKRIEELMSERLRERDGEYWLEELTKRRVPCAPVNDFRGALNDTQVLARDMVVEVPLPDGATQLMPGNPIKIGEGRQTFAPPPELGAHTDMVMQEMLGLSGERIRELRGRGIVA